QHFGTAYHQTEHLMRFYPKFAVLGDAGEYIHPTMYRGTRKSGSAIGDNGNFLHFDVKEGKLAFDFRYDPESPLSIEQQFSATAGRAILDGPLNRKFMVGVGDLGILREVLENNKDCGIPIALLWDGDAETVGVRQPESLTASSWRFFFPSESPEVNAIAFAIEYQRTQKDLQRFPTEEQEARKLQESAVANYQTAMKTLARQAPPA
ncbi:MAG TPA: hypothetical protein VJJ20_00805, partial [Candidatus Paceibacterota bacterium]